MVRRMEIRMNAPQAVTYKSTFLVLLGKEDNVEFQLPRETRIEMADTMAKMMHLAVGLGEYNLTYTPFTGGLDKIYGLADDAGKVYRLFPMGESYIGMKRDAQRQGFKLVQVPVSISCEFVKMIYMKNGDRYFRDYREV